MNAIDEEELQDRDGEAEIPKCARDPGEPTAKERAEHEVTHLPYRSWCKQCVMGRGRDNPHQHRRDRSEQGLPIIGIDFFFIGDPKTESLVPAVSIRD